MALSKYKNFVAGDKLPAENVNSIDPDDRAIDDEFRLVRINKDNKIPFYELYFGDGSDGDVVISVDTDLSADMYYNNLTINPGITLNPNGYRIFVKNKLLNNGIIARNGNDGGNGSYNNDLNDIPFAGGIAGPALADGTIKGGTAGSAGGAGKAQTGSGTSTESSKAGSAGGAGTSINPALANINGTNGGNGGYSSTSYRGLGGVGGTSTKENLSISLKTQQITSVETEELIEFLNIIKGVSSSELLSNLSSSGGGGGGSLSKPENASSTVKSGAGGGSGGNGGVIYIQARIIDNTNGVINAKGGNGGNGSNGWAQSPANNAGGGGGGAGGQGGIIIFIYNEIVGEENIDVSGGKKGLKGTSVGTWNAPQDGNDGNDGTYIKIKLNQ